MHETIGTEQDAVKVIQAVLQASPFPCISSSELSKIKFYLLYLNAINGLNGSMA